MDERWPNQGEFDNVGSDTLSFPTGVFFDAEREKVFVVDQGNHRVLIWNKLPRETGVAADVVIGVCGYLFYMGNCFFLIP